MIIAMRALKLGDFLVAVPALRAIRRHWPSSEFRYAGPAWLTPLAELTGCLDGVLATDGLSPLPPTPSRPEVVVNLHGAGPQSNRVLDALRPLRRIGHGGHGWEGPAWVEAQHERNRWCRMLDAHGIPVDPGDLRLRRPALPSAAPGAVVVHPGAAYGSKRWPANRFAEVAGALARAGHHVLVTGSAQERSLVEEVVARAGHGVRAAGPTTLIELAALIADASLLVCGDTGTAHLAYAFGTASVVLFGPAPVEAWGPPADGPHVVLTAAHLRRGSGFTDDPDPALLGVEVAEVLDAATGLLANSRRSEMSYPSAAGTNPMP